MFKRLSVLVVMVMFGISLVSCGGGSSSASGGQVTTNNLAATWTQNTTAADDIKTLTMTRASDTLLNIVGTMGDDTAITGTLTLGAVTANVAANVEKTNVSKTSTITSRLATLFITDGFESASATGLTTISSDCKTLEFTDNADGATATFTSANNSCTDTDGGGTTTTVYWMFTPVGDCTGQGMPEDTNGLYRAGTCTTTTVDAGGVTVNIAVGATTGTLGNCEVQLQQGDVTCATTAEYQLEVANCHPCDGTFTVDPNGPRQ
ncbi:MAG: hypothetical protein ABIE74_06750 [Pseudomonadota bacterium]